MKKEFLNIVKAVSEKESQPHLAFDLIEESMNAFMDYVKSVYDMEIKSPILRERMEGQDLLRSLENLDRNRRNAHEVAIHATNIMNRLCDKIGLPHFYQGTPNDRYEIADFCQEVVNEFFAERDLHKKSLDELKTAAIPLAKRDELVHTVNGDFNLKEYQDMVLHGEAPAPLDDITESEGGEVFFDKER